jgi:hypothetical protein
MGRCAPLSEGHQHSQGASEFDAVRKLIQWVDLQAQHALQRYPSSSLVHLAVLSFFDLVGQLHTQANVPFMVVLSYPIAQRCLLHTCPLIISRLCGLLESYRNEIEGLKQCYSSSNLTRTARAGANGLQDIPRFNSFVLDACNALWRNRSFIDSSTESSSQVVQVEAELSCLRLPKETLEALQGAVGRVLVYLEGQPPHHDQKVWGAGGRTTYELRRVLSITHGLAWQGHVRAFLRTAEVAGSSSARQGSCGTLEMTSVHTLENPNIKAAYLDQLRASGFVGLYDFLHAFISSLAKRKSGASFTPREAPS